ncbi:MAG: L-aspartate oxidase [Actinomycetota bacterium]|nr:L-aspartate oxidase [Actinomycetota bacterium]
MIPRYLVSFDTGQIPNLFCDVLVIGSGVAGLSTAHSLSHFCDAMLVTKAGLKDSNTNHAQGGIAAVLDEHDSFESHIRDTLLAGAGLSDPVATQVLVTEGPSRVVELLRDYHAKFDMRDEHFDFAREGGHSCSRVVHARGDATGSEVETALSRAVIDENKVKIIEGAFAVDLLMDGKVARGCLVFDSKGKLIAIWSKFVILASGGTGMIYLVTTNPRVSTGDGLAVAFRAGARISDVEFVQFHPTALHIPEEPKFLISEALRGRGAFIVDVEGNRIMEGIHPLLDLAPRDVVASRMFEVMKEERKNHLYLETRHIDPILLRKEFPTIFQHCLEAGIDIRKMRIPVSPAAHYMSGGVVVDLDGQTDIPGLFACGEVSCTGVHGANRLASNSLLEGLVFSKRIAEYLENHVKDFTTSRYPRISFELDWRKPRFKLGLLRGNLREVMTDSVGMMRCEKGLKEAFEFFERNEEILQTEFMSVPGMELKNMFEVGMMVAMASYLRKETRGCHRRRDYPDVDDWNWKKHIDLKLEDGEICHEGRLTHHPGIDEVELKFVKGFAYGRD